MLMKNRNTFDFTHKHRFKTVTRDNLGGALLRDKSGGGRGGGGLGHLHTLHIPKAATETLLLKIRKNRF